VILRFHPDDEAISLQANASMRVASWGKGMRANVIVPPKVKMPYSRTNCEEASPLGFAEGRIRQDSDILFTAT
jgi:hypothetical protein